MLSPVETGSWAAQGSAPRGRRKCRARPALTAGPQRRLCPRPCGQGVPGGAARGSHWAPSQAPLRSAQARAVRMVTGELELVQITPAALSRSPALRGLGLGKQPLPPLLPSPLPLWPGLIQTQVMRMKPRPLQREACWVCSQPHPLDEGSAPGKWPLPSKGRGQRSRRCVSLTARAGRAAGPPRGTGRLAT